MGHVIDASAKFERRQPALGGLAEYEREFERLRDNAREMTHDHEPWMAWWQVDRNDDGTVKRILRNRYDAKEQVMVLWAFEFSADELVKRKYRHLELHESEVLEAWTRPLPLEPDRPYPCAVFYRQVGQRDADTIIGYLRSSGTPGNWGSDAAAHA